ncbi:MAG: T9SS type A sorting domain-containing protein [Sphingobacteriales bacterium]|nr:MAG: T9SS type A sorting domain-containing protein [Sphingobacteriales bacterium]
MKPQQLAGGNYDMKYHRTRWAVDPNIRYITGEVTSYFVPTEPSVATISFDFSSQLQLDSVRYHGQPVTTAQVGNELQITLPAPIMQGQLDSVTIWYQGNPPQTGFGSFIKMNHAQGPIIWTLSDPWGGKDWWPCKMTLDDKVDSTDIYITTPQAYKAGSNGKLVSTQTIGTDKTYHWRHRYPITNYLIAMAVSNYEEFTVVAPLSQGPLDIVNYVYPQTLATAQSQVPGIVPIIQLYDTLFTPYPYMGEKYGHAEFSWGGGMEHQTMSFMANFDRDLMAHELAHQWFGNKVTCASWHDMWLNEGWATYVESLVYERMNTPAQWLAWKTSEINLVTSAAGGSVYVSDTTNINRIFDSRLTYSKGGMLLHMLRWVVGDSAFFAATRNYLNDPALAYKYALTADFKQHLEQASGKNLTEFFNDWYYGQGYPRYQISWHQNQTSGELQVTINQTSSHSSVSFFEMPVPVRFTNGSADTTLVFNHTTSGQSFTVPIGFMATSATLDPEKWIVQKNSTVTSVPEIDIQSAVKVYPNPAHDKMYVSMNFPAQQTIHATLTDALGRVVISKQIPGFEADGFELDVTALQTGIYHLQLRSADWVITRKVARR